MAESKNPPQRAREETRGPRTLEEAMSRLEPLAATRGQLVVTDGAVDIRLYVERGLVELEVKGRPLPEGSSADVSIARGMLEVLFWESPVMDLASGANARPSENGGERSCVRVERPDAPRELCRAIADEAASLDAVRRKVPSLGVVAGATSTTSTAKGGDALAAKLRRALTSRGGELSLAEWARAEKLHPCDAASAFAGLIEVGEARVAKKQDGPAAQARIEAGLASGGFVPGLRLEAAARSLAPKEPMRAAQAFCRAGWERLAAGRPTEGADDFEQALALLSPEKASSSGERPVDTGEVALEAREGLVVAIEAEAGRKAASASSGGQDTRSLETRPFTTAKRASAELGRVYLALGLANRARVALERGLDDNAPPGAQLELLGALIEAGQLSRAIERAEGLASRLDGSQRRALAERIVEAGAKGPTFDRALALAGTTRDRQVSKILLGSAAFLVLVALAFGREAQGRAELAAYGNDLHEKLGKGRAKEDLATPFIALSSSYSPFPCASDAKAVETRIRDLAHDADELAANGGAFSWKNAPSPVQARTKIQALHDGARTPELRLPLEGVLARFDRWEREARNEMQAVREAAVRKDSQAALETARHLLEAFPTWQEQWKGLLVPVTIEPVPDSALVEWNGHNVDGPPFYVHFPIEAAATGVLRVSGDPQLGWIAQERKLAFADVSPVVKVVLDRKAVPPTKHGTGPTSTPTTGTGDKPPKPKIQITGDPVVDAPKPSTDEPVPEKKPRFEVTEVSGAELREKLGVSGTVEVQPSPGFFDFLKREVPQNLRLTVEVVTTVRDGKVFFDGTNLRLEDVVLGKTIQPRFVAEDPPCERAVRATQNGGRTVEPVTRALHLDKDKLRETLRDELRSKIDEFNRSETGR